MPDIQNTPGGDRIEELLGQLKGIFGKLSESEEQEAKQKIGPPPLSPASTPPPATPKPAEPTASMPAPEFREPPLTEEAPLPELPSESDATPLPPPPELISPDIDSPPANTTPTAMSSPPPASSEPFTPSEATAPTGGAIIYTAIFFPEGRATEAKAVAQKIERITPKFTKVAFVLNVQSINAYNLKSDLKSAVQEQVQSGTIKAILVLIDKPLEETRRKALQAELEPKGVYFQEVPVQQIEKKALFTDMLLGMVFFYDSQKPPTPESKA